MRSIFVIALLLFVSSAPAQTLADNTAANPEEVECEEALEYLEFLKVEYKEKIEKILHDTLFKPSAILATTVFNAMKQTLSIRNAILDRIENIRNKDKSITICPQQDVNQEKFLTQARNEIRAVLLSLIEQDSATPAKLQEIGKQLLSARTNVNTEITRITSLREKSFVPNPTIPDGKCDCGILGEIVDRLDGVISPGGATVGGPADGAGDAAMPAANAAETTDDDDADGTAEGGEMSHVRGLTTTLKTIDARIAELYNQILRESNEGKRTKFSDEQTMLKEFSVDLNDVVSKVAKEDPNSDPGKTNVERLVKRDVTRIRNEIKRKKEQCEQLCPGQCKSMSCGYKKVEVLKNKLQEHKSIIEDLEEEEAKEDIRNDLMVYLTKIDTEMTDLLKERADLEVGNTLTVCQSQQLEVLEKVKGPLWMLVNAAIFESEDILNEMITALEQSLVEMSAGYCTGTVGTPNSIPEDEQTCDLDEIEAAKDFTTKIDKIITDHLFKANDDDARKDALKDIIDLKSDMDKRVRTIYSNIQICPEEVKQINSAYMDKLNACLSEMMNPKIDFLKRTRAERVRCVKELRISIEARHGELLLREVEKSIQQAQATLNGVAENKVPQS